MIMMKSTNSTRRQCFMSCSTN